MIAFCNEVRDLVDEETVVDGYHHFNTAYDSDSHSIPIDKVMKYKGWEK